MEEVWIKIINYDGYEISTKGQIRSLDRKIIQINGSNRFFNGKILKQNIDKLGYKRCCIRIKNNRTAKNLTVHRLVAQAFIPNPLNLPQVNHIDGDKTNNNIENLEWCTAKENINHGHNNGLYDNIIGEKNYNSKLSNKEVLEIRELWKTGKYFQRHLSEKYNVTITTISYIVNNKSRNKI